MEKTSALLIALAYINYNCISGLVLTGKCADWLGDGKIRYTVKNVLVEPIFTSSVVMDAIGCNNVVLTKYMERACDDRKDIFTNFSSTYFPNIGYYISAINGVSETSNYSYWELIEHSNGVQKQVGPYTYIPQPGDHIGWNLTAIY